MIAAERLRVCRERGDVLALFRDLGYDVHPIAVDPAEWRRAGIELPWNGAASLTIVSRMRRFDLFLLEGVFVGEESLRSFMRSYHAYQCITKSVVAYIDSQRSVLSIYDLSATRELRRLDVSLVAPTPHALDRLNLLAIGSGAEQQAEPPMTAIFDRALDRESVTREFFERFRSAVRETADSLAVGFPNEPSEQVDAEALLLLSRLLFLSFIQEKGWLNGERRFLVDRLGSCIRDGRPFFTDVLLPLFFGCLNTSVGERDDAARQLGRIPYLNGGLFEPSPFESRHLPDDAFQLSNELMTRALEQVFEKFDFRITEGDTAGTHVDPEMLGKVFESLMAADERAASGSFYTPREIVDTLTSRAVDCWLGERDSASDPHALLARLESITVLDPACGSGAFLLSALGVIERTTRRLSEKAGVAIAPDLRRRIVERSLYGVDLKPEAVRLCELRLWLAIVAAWDGAAEEVQPLPNLDRNILQGNSLLSPTDFLGDGRAEIYREWMYALKAQRDLIDRYRVATHDERPALFRLIRGNDQTLAVDLLTRSMEADETELQDLSAPQRDLFGRALQPDLARCRQLQERIGSKRRTLDDLEQGRLDFFSFDVHFAHVMAQGGFDVVAGNPPWVRNSRIDMAAKRKYSERYALFRPAGERASFHQPDLAIVFFERALALTAPGGVTAMLMPAKIANAAYAAPLRRSVQESLTIELLHDWSDDARRWFDADTFPLGVVTTRGRRSRQVIEVRASQQQFRLKQSELSVGRPGSEWSLVPPPAAAVLRRLREQHRALSDVLHRRAVMGVKTGDNRSFFLDDARLVGRYLVTSDDVRVPISAVCRCVRGRDVRRWSVAESQWMLWPPAKGWGKPPVWLRQLAELRGLDTKAFRLAYVRAEHVGIKVAWKDLARGFCAAVLPDLVSAGGHTFPLVPNQTLYSLDAVSLDEAYAIAALLNSTVVDALLLCIAERAKDAHFRYFGRTVDRIPIPELESGSMVWEKLVRLSRRAHQGSDVAAELDATVAMLYGVTSGELEVLRELVDRRLGRDSG